MCTDRSRQTFLVLAGLSTIARHCSRPGPSRVPVPPNDYGVVKPISATRPRIGAERRLRRAIGSGDRISDDSPKSTQPLLGEKVKPGLEQIGQPVPENRPMPAEMRRVKDPHVSETPV